MSNQQTNQQINIANYEEIKQLVAKNIKSLQQAMGWNNSKVAEITNVSNPSVGKYVSAICLPDLPFLIKLCAAASIKVTINDLLSTEFKPETAQQANHGTGGKDFIDSHSDMLGNYFCYYYDQSKPVHEQDYKTTRELRFGIMSIYDYYDCVTSEHKMKVSACFYKESEKEKAIKAKEDLDNIFSKENVIANRNQELHNYYYKISGAKDDVKEERKDVGVYEGEVTFGKQQHIFINFNSTAYSDSALMILYAPPKRADSEYLGGLGSVASISHGSMHMPTAQKIIVSKYNLNCSYEEIGDYLNVCSAPISLVKESEAIADLCDDLYTNASINTLLDPFDKNAIITNRLNQLVRNYIEKNVCCVASISKDDDKRVYELIKKFAK